MISTITAVLIAHSIEIGASSVFLIGFGTYVYVKGVWKENVDKLVFYDLTDRIIKSKKIQQRITNRVGGNKQNETFFKAS